MSDLDDRLNAAATVLRAARTGPLPADLPAVLVPRPVAEACRIQDLVTGQGQVAGWKILASAAPADFSCAPLAAEMQVPDGGLLAWGGFAPDALAPDHRIPEIEVEIAIRLARDLPPRILDGGEVLAAAGTAHAVFELVCSRFTDRKAASPLSTLADRKAAAALPPARALRAGQRWIWLPVPSAWRLMAYRWPGGRRVWMPGRSLRPWSGWPITPRSWIAVCWPGSM